MKSRLAAVLDEDGRERLAALMLSEVLNSFSGAGLISRCHVVSSSGWARGLAERAGAHSIAEPADGGVNSAVGAGMKEVDSEEYMVVPADLPLLSVPEIKSALSLKSSGMEVLIAPSLDFDGTNLLMFERSKGFPLSFDQDSFWNHLRWASKKRYRVAVYSARGFRFDVDTIAHLQELAATRSHRPAVSFAREALR